MKIYLSGPMSGYHDMNREAFKNATLDLRQQGHEVTNPVETDCAVDSGRWSDFLKKDIALLTTCDTVVVLPGWEDSKGARLEVFTAFDLGLAIYRYWHPKHELCFMMRRHDCDKHQG